MRDYETNDIISLSNSINGIAYEFGIKKTVHQDDCIMIAKDLEASFSDFTAEEIKNVAFLYRTQDLGYEESHYQELSSHFLAGCLKAYRIKRNKALSKIQKDNERLERDRLNADVGEYKVDPRFTEYYLMRAEMSMVYNKALETGKKINIQERYSSNFFRHLITRQVLTLSTEFKTEWRQKGYDSLSKSFKSNERLQNAFTKMQFGKEIYNVEELKFKKMIQERSAKLFIDEWLTEKANKREVFAKFFVDFE